MRILFFTDTLDVGGKERRLTELIKALLRTGGTDFELVVMSSEIHYREILDLGIKIHYITRKTRHDISIFKRFHELCQVYKPDLIHCWDSMTAVYLVPVCRLLGIKLINGMVVDAPSRQNISNKYYLRAKLTFPFSDVIVGNSEAGLRAYRAPLRKSVVIHNGFDFKRTRNLKDRDEILKELQSGDKFLVGMVASFGPYKDYPAFYHAAETILRKRDDVIFVAIGNRTDSDESLNIIAGEYRDKFRLLGRRQNPESYVNVMDVCILSTFTEGISNSIMEYMALGKPVVATDGGWTCEIVQNGTTGYLVGQSDPALLAEKIGCLLDDKELRTRMGEAGCRRVADYFSISRMTDRYLDLYRNLKENGKIIN
jgi:glycosyltransferase involved in cell wall biosynthesis